MLHVKMKFICLITLISPEQLGLRQHNFTINLGKNLKFILN